MLPLLASTALAQNISVVGSCPGPMDGIVTGITPSGRFAAVTGVPGGRTLIPAGQPCAGTRLDVGNATPRVVTQANAQGAARLSANVPAGLCGQDVQILDITTCTKSPAVPINPQPVCNYPSTPFGAGGPVQQLMADPVYMGVQTYNVFDGGLAQDFAYVDPAGVRTDYSAQVQFRFLDAGFTQMCSVWYDLSPATADAGLAAFDSAGAAMAVQNGLTITLANGYTDCGFVDPRNWGGIADLRDYVESLGDWSFATSPISPSMEVALRGVIDPVTWATDWDPYVFSMANGVNGTVYESDYAFTYDSTCDEVYLDQLGYLTPVAPSAPAEGYVGGSDYYVWVL